MGGQMRESHRAAPTPLEATWTGDEFQVTARSLISRGTPGSEAGARGSRLAAAWQPPGSRAS